MHFYWGRQIPQRNMLGMAFICRGLTHRQLTEVLTAPQACGILCVGTGWVFGALSKLYAPFDFVHSFIRVKLLKKCFLGEVLNVIEYHFN